MSMNFIPPFDLELCVRGHCFDQEVLQVWHAHVETADDEISHSDLEMAADIVGAFVTPWIANVLPLLQEDYSADYMALKVIEPLPIMPILGWKYRYDAEVGFPGAAVGGDAGDVGSIFEAATIRLKSTLRSRRFRGSKRHSPVVNTKIIDNEIDSTLRTALTTAYSALIGSFKTGLAAIVGNSMVGYLTIASLATYKEAGPPQFWRELTNGSCNVNAGSQITRKRKGGFH